MSKAINMLGQKIGRLFVISRAGFSRSGDCMWKCQCDCNGPNSIRIITGSNLFKRKTTSCGCYQRENAQRLYYKGSKDISGKYFSKIKYDALDRGLEFNITLEQIQELLEKQDYRCALSGIKINGCRSFDKRSSTHIEQTASLDRIDSSKGYVIENVQWVHKDVNNMKQAFPQDYFIEVCKMIAQNN